MRSLEETFKELYPLPDNHEEEHYPAEHELPHPRATFLETPRTSQDAQLLAEEKYLEAHDHYITKVVANRRITAEEWEQDVRHFELEFEDDIRYVLSLVTP